MDFDLSPEVEELRDRIRAFMDEHVYPNELEAMRALDAEVTARDAPTREILVEIRDQGPRGGPLEPVHARRALRRRASPTGSTASSARRWAAARRSRRWPSTARRPTPATWRSSPSTAPTSRRSAGCEPLLDGRDPQLLLDDRARGLRLRPDHAADPGRARRRRVGDQRPQVVHLRRGRRLGRDRDGRHRPRRPPVRAGVDDPGAHRRPGLQPDPPGPGDGPRRRPRPLRDPLRGLPRARGQPARPARRPAS